jgi:hypothetical protein
MTFFSFLEPQKLDIILKHRRQTAKLEMHSSQYYVFIILSGVRLGPLGTAATTGLLYQPQIIDDGDCGAIGGMRTSRRNRSTRRKPAPVPVFPPQIPHNLTWARTRISTVGSQRLTA